MKLHMKIVVIALLLFSLISGQQSGQVKAAYDYTNQGCSAERGRDIIFVIQDTPEMQKHDPEQSRVTEVQKLMDRAETKDRFGLIGFDNGLTKELALTTNKIQAKNTLNTFGTNIGTVNGNDLSIGFEKAIQGLSKKDNANDKLIVIMTVGTSINNMKLQELATEAYAEDIKVHTVSFGDPVTVDSSTLTSIANRTGGNYNHSPNAAFLWNVLSNLNQQVIGFTGREVASDWKLTQDVHESRGLMLHENVKVDLNGYNLTVAGDLVLLSCSELRAVSGVITAKNIDQKSGASIRLNNSQLKVLEFFSQDGLVSINGDYRGMTVPEIDVNEYVQRIHGYLDVKGEVVQVASEFMQEGRVDLDGGTLHAKGNIHQKGHFNVQGGMLQVDGNLTIDGGPLKDDAFLENKSLNVGGGVVQVGSQQSMGETRQTGNVKQMGGQLFINHGTVRIFGDYSIADGWLTMVKGSMDTTPVGYGEGDGDYVHVHGDFSMESPRNHAKRDYMQIGKPMHDQGHLTDGVLKVEGSFGQKGNEEAHEDYTDRSQNYREDFGRFNFQAAGRHKVVLTGKQNINVEGTGFTFNLLELHGNLQDYTQTGPVEWKGLIEIDKAANAKLASLTINDRPIVGFSPNVANYFEVPGGSFTPGVPTLKVDARAEDHRNAKVDVLNNTWNSDGTAQVKVLVTAADGRTQMLYTINVTAGTNSGGAVTGIILDRDEVVFMKGAGGFQPDRVTLRHTIQPTNAVNQQVVWTSRNPSVATVNPSGIITPVRIGETTVSVKTNDGGFIASVTVKVKNPADLAQGIHTLADFVSNNQRYDQLMEIYDHSKMGIVVPGEFITSVNFDTAGILVFGTVETNSSVQRLVVNVNGSHLAAQPLGQGTNKFRFSRAGLAVGDSIEVVAYNATGDELERVTTTYPVDYIYSNDGIPYGFHSIASLLNDPVGFDIILGKYSPEQLRFVMN